jgi:hypothetical protein
VLTPALTPVGTLKELLYLGRGALAPPEGSAAAAAPSPAAEAAARAAAAEAAARANPAAARRLAAVEAAVQHAAEVAAALDEFNTAPDLPSNAEERDDRAEDAVRPSAGSAGQAAPPSPAPPATPAQAREAVLAKIRAVAFSGSLRPEAMLVRVGGVEMVNSRTQAAIVASLARERRDYPAYFAEVAGALGMGPGKGGKSAHPQPQPAQPQLPSSSHSPAREAPLAPQPAPLPPRCCWPRRAACARGGSRAAAQRGG